MIKRNTYPSKYGYELINSCYDKLTKKGLAKFIGGKDKWIYLGDEYNIMSAIYLKENCDIDIYYTANGVYSTNIFMFGDSKILYTNGVDFYSIKKISKKDNYGFFDEWLDHYSEYVKGHNKFNAFTHIASTEYEHYVDDYDCHILVDVLTRLYLVLTQYFNGEVTVSNDPKCVTLYNFNSQSGKYTSEIRECFKMHYCLEKMELPFNNNTYKLLEGTNIIPGKLYLSTFQFNVIHDIINKKNGIESKLRTILFYAVDDSGNINYLVDSTKEYDYEKTVRNNIINLIRKSGLFDEVITDNPVIYYLFKKEIKRLGVDIKFSFDCALLNKTCFALYGFYNVLGSTRILDFAIKALEKDIKKRMEAYFEIPYSSQELSHSFEKAQMDNIDFPASPMVFDQTDIEINSEDDILIDDDEYYDDDDDDDDFLEEDKEDTNDSEFIN